MVGGYYEGEPLSLYSARANTLARELVLPRLFPGATRIQAEPRHEGGRFDFAVEHSGAEHLVEVKACTLIHAGVGMFPDAVSARATRHLEELARSPGKSHVVFVLMRPGVERFVPDIHTDPQFSRTLRDLADRIHIHAVSLRAEASGAVETANPEVPVDLSPVRLVEEDRGVYLVTLRLTEPRRIRVGALGELDFPAGHYVYVGSGRQHLGARLRRHLRRKKRMHWHVDYLRAEAEEVRAYPVYTSRPLESALADDVSVLAGEAGGRAVPGFGSSDSPAASHLLHFPEPPMRNPAFVKLLLDYRHRRAIS